MKEIIESLSKKYKKLNSLLNLSAKLSGNEFNSLLLELFKIQNGKISPSDLVRHYTENRFVIPSTVNVLAFKALELEWLSFADKNAFTPIILSPLTPLGTCSVVAEVHQNNVVSASRRAEVVTDVTNVLALKIANDFKATQNKDIVKYATAHRHVRGQSFTNTGFTAHFGVFCLVSGGLDTGDYNFEMGQLLEHIAVHLSLLMEKFDPKNLSLKLHIRENNPKFVQLLEHKLTEKQLTYELIEDYEKGDYYCLIQFKINLKYKDMDINVADGGLVDWTQKLIPNKKHRLFISGCGIELVHKMLDGQF